MWIPGAIAAAALIAVVSWWSGPTTVQAPELVAEKPAPVVKQQVLAVAQPKVLTTPKKRPRRTQLAAAPKPEPKPQPFVQLPFAPAFSQYDEAQVVRVTMPGASARGLGFAVSGDRVQADVVVGYDGVARAIRMVSNSGLNSIR